MQGSHNNEELNGIQNSICLGLQQLLNEHQENGQEDEYDGNDEYYQDLNHFHGK